MKPDRTAFEKTVRRHLSLLGSPSVSQVEASRRRIHERLRAHHEAVQSGAPPVGAAGLRYAWRVGLSLAVAATVIVLVVMAPWRGTDWLATVEAADGSRYSLEPNALLRSNDARGMMLTLKDGSRVEMRSHSELALERADDGIGIRLHAGGIIVNTAKQRDGHLYVHTKDMTVSGVGTVFLVNAEDEGSRVGVIEGEASVREATLDTRLRPGEQVSTSRALATRPLTEGVAWSRQKDAYLAILASFAKGMTDTSAPLTQLADPAGSARAPANQASPVAAGQAFEEAAVRQCDPDNLPPLPAGARGGGANSFYMTPGRTYALCMTPATLIRTAYGYGPAELEFFMNDGLQGRGLTAGNVYGLGVESGVRVRGGPDWVRNEPYTIEAVADGAADGAAMSGPMLRALLANRFRLKVHVETEQVPAFALSVAPGGLKIKPVQATGIAPDGFVRAGARTDACEPGPPPDVPAVRIPRSFVEVRRGEKPSCGVTTALNGPNFVVVGGAAGMPALGRVLGSRLGNVRVVDNTGITDLFNFILEFVLDENTPDGRINVPRPQMAVDPSSVPRGATIFRALEEQLGLKLEPARTPREFIVIDAIERPGPN